MRQTMPTQKYSYEFSSRISTVCIGLKVRDVKQSGAPGQRGIVSRLGAGKIDRVALHADVALQRSAVVGAGEGDVGEGFASVDVEEEIKLINAEVAADDAGDAVLAVERSTE